MIVRKLFGDRISIPHIYAVLQKSTFKKIKNILTVIIELKIGVVNVSGYPFIVFLEVNNICNLKCPFCLTGKGEETDRQKRNMSIDEMIKSVEAVKDYVYLMQIYNWGEPFLNHELIKFVEYANKNKIYSIVSSNMNFTREGIPEEIVDSKLDYLICGIDGMTEESYKKYRDGNKISLPLEY